MLKIQIIQIIRFIFALSNYNNMKRYYIYYWLYRNDEWQDFETEIEALNLEDAFKDFKDKKRLSKIQEIKLIP